MREIERYMLYNRVTTRSDWVLYVHDYYWVLVMDGYYEFYYNPLLYLGKIKADNMPGEAVYRINSSCRKFTAKDRDEDRGQHVGRNARNLCIAEMPMKSGNVFYAMGAWCATSRKQFFFTDPYTGESTVCGIKEMSWFSADCMMRMSTKTKTNRYFPDIPSLKCFAGLKVDHLIDRDL